MASRYGSSRYGLSTELSDAEASLEDRVDAAVTTAPFRGSELTPSVAAYKIMQQDMQDRSRHNGLLAQEQQLAFSSSARRKLADQARENDDYTIEARDSLAELGKRVAAGDDPDAALSALVTINPKLMLNPAFNKAAKDFSGFAETPEEAQIRRTRRGLELTQLGTDRFNVDKALKLAEDESLDLDELIQTARGIREANVVGSKNKVLGQQLESLELGARRQAYEKTNLLRDKYMAELGADDGTALAALYDSFDQVGLGDVESPDVLWESLNGPQKAMLGDKRFLDRLTGEGGVDKASLSQTLNDFTSGDPSVKAAANRRLMTLAGRHRREMGEEIERLKLQKEKQAREDRLNIARERKVGAEARSYNDLVEDLTSLQLNATKPDRDGNTPGPEQQAATVSAINARATAFMQSYAQANGLEGDMGAAIEKVPMKGNQVDVDTAVHLALSKMREVLEKGDQGVQPAPTPGAAQTSATRPASGDAYAAGRQKPLDLTR